MKHRMIFLGIVSICVACSSAAAQWVHDTKLTAADHDEGDEFGVSVAMDGDTIVIGSWDDYDRRAFRGAAYFFRREGDQWRQVGKIGPDNSAGRVRFGCSVSIDGDTALVGAFLDDARGGDSGSAYIFREIDGSWQQMAKLLAADGTDGDWFGLRTCLHGDLAVVAAPSDNDGGLRGSVYIFREIGNEWRQEAKIISGDGRAAGGFGQSLWSDGNVVLVAAPGYTDTSGTGGAIYTFEEINGQWRQVERLTHDVAEIGDSFGASISRDRELLVVGAPFDDDLAPNSGAAYLFQRSEGQWQVVAKLRASDGSQNDHFGTSVSINGGTIVISAPYDDDLGTDSGSAYVFREVAGIWTEIVKLTAPDGALGDEFGKAICLYDNTIIAGVPFDDDAGEESGSAHVFTFICIADFDDNGVVNTLDIVVYLRAFNGQDPAADLNADGVVNTLDFLVFLNAFNEGC